MKKVLPPYIKGHFFTASMFVHLRDNADIDDIQVWTPKHKSISVGLKDGKIVYLRFDLDPGEVPLFDESLIDKDPE